MRRGAPQTRGREALLACGFVEPAEDAAVALVTYLLDALTFHASQHRRLSGCTGDLDRRGVRHLGHQRAEQRQLLHLTLAADVQHLLREGLPAQLWLFAQ